MASSEVIERDFEGVLRELGLKVEGESFGVWRAEVRKIVEEKNERDGGPVAVAIAPRFGRRKN